MATQTIQLPVYAGLPWAMDLQATGLIAGDTFAAQFKPARTSSVTPVTADVSLSGNTITISLDAAKTTALAAFGALTVRGDMIMTRSGSKSMAIYEIEIPVVQPYTDPTL